MTAVADIFDRDGDGYIDYYEFVAALHPNKDAYRPTTDADKIEDEVRPPRENFFHVTKSVSCTLLRYATMWTLKKNRYRFFHDQFIMAIFRF